MSGLRPLAPGVHVHERPLRFFGLEVGARMTVLSLEGGLLLHSPTDVDPAEVEAVGTPRWVLAPNLLHHLYIGPWMARGAEGWCGPGMPEKRTDLEFTGVVTEPCEPFGPEVLLIPLAGFWLTREVAMLHRPSRTLVLTDLMFNFGPTAAPLTKMVLCCGGAYPGPSVTPLERFGVNRAATRNDLRQLLALDFDRLVLAHGDVVETGGKHALRAAFRWLEPLGAP